MVQLVVWLWMTTVTSKRSTGAVHTTYNVHSGWWYIFLTHNILHDSLLHVCCRSGTYHELRQRRHDEWSFFFADYCYLYLISTALRAADIIGIFGWGLVFIWNNLLGNFSKSIYEIAVGVEAIENRMGHSRDGQVFSRGWSDEID